ncbi:MAG: glycoside hydrolase family 2 TIM barrel-domain containing protein [Planctomycetota bacterium]
MLALLWTTASARSDQPRQSQSLDGPWEISLDSGASWHPFTVPAPVEDRFDWDFEGVSQFRREIQPVRVDSGERLFLRFSAVAARAKVYFKDELVGENLGGWTPFECEITEQARRSSKETAWKLRVEVDELVGHNTQGFLPVVIPHFGGIWQSVSLIKTGSNRFLQDRTLATTAQVAEKNAAATQLTVRLGINSPHTLNGRRVEIALRKKGADDFASLKTAELSELASPAPEVPFTAKNDRFYECTLMAEVEKWSPEAPTCYQLRLRLLTARGDVEDEVLLPISNRSIAATADSITLNGRPLVLRGVLNWGYAPPSFAPTLDETAMRKEIEFARDRGFNLMKFCLWIPPQRYLELCDEYGLLAWIEYPTWHPQLDQKHLPELQREFQEFFEYDRNHPCVILRSLTCETGPSADIKVIQDLYDRCKLACPGAIVEDDSSWISWNRVTDFYDDHPYGNNHTWVRTLEGLKQYISEHDPKPLVLGEAIAADAFRLSGDHPYSPRELNQFIAPRDAEKKPLLTSPHAPWADSANGEWKNKISAQAEKLGLSTRLELLAADSRHYGLLMRKYQIETYRREVPTGGYVVSVIRDFPKASMGLIDFAGQPKNTAADWSFQGDGMLLLESQQDRRSFQAAQPTSFGIQFTWSGRDTAPATSYRVHLADSTGKTQELLAEGTVPAVEFGQPQRVAFNATLPAVETPTRFLLRAEWLRDSLPAVRNEWPIWIFPAALGGDSVLIRLRDEEGPKDWSVTWREVGDEKELSAEDIVFAAGFSNDLLAHLNRGGKAVIVPNDTVNSLPTSQHWFLRGSPLGLEQPGTNWLAKAPFASGETTDLLNELQHFDLAGPVVPQVEHFGSEVLPLVLLWDNHDMTETRTHAAAFILKVGSGRALVTTLNHGGATNAAGQWLLANWLGLLKSTELPAAVPDLGPRLQRELSRQGMILHERNWKFRPDPEDAGAKSGWSETNFDDSAWGELRADRHWEGQGFKELDFWAWYRLRVKLPETWTGPCYLNLTGVDDYCDIYVNGRKVGSSGDLVNRKTGFEERTSFDLTQLVKPGDDLVIAIAVYDWYGAGGLFKPMTLSTQPLDQAPPMLK